MNLKKILLSSVAAVALTSVAAMAADTGVASVAADQTGDYLVFPAYYANSAGWSTNIKVVNTNTTHAVVAKVVIREYMSSAEKLDFPIYLTPGDVWEGTLKNVDGKVYVASTDDSMFNNGAPASDVNPVNQVLFDPVALTQDNTKGYVEVFGFASIPAVAVTPSWTVGTPLSKTALRDRFNLNLNGSGVSTVGWTAVDNDSIYGQEVISAANANGNLAMTLMATAFENVTGTTPNTGVVIALDSTLQTNTTQASEAAIIAEIEAALLTSNVYVTYYDASSTSAAETALLLTQPMKKYRYTNSGLNLTGVGYAGATPDAVGPLSYTFKYAPTARNQMETSLVNSTDYSGGTPTTYTCNTEICQISINQFVGSFTKGYVDFSLAQTGYTAMPVIPAVMTAKSVGSTNVTNIIYPATK